MMRLLAVYGFRFQTGEDKAFIETFIFTMKRPQMRDVQRNIEQHRKRAPQWTNA